MRNRFNNIQSVSDNPNAKISPRESVDGKHWTQNGGDRRDGCSLTVGQGGPRKKEAGEPIVILDVREPDEWEQGVIEGAVLLSRGRIESRLEELVPDKDGLIVTH